MTDEMTVQAQRPSAMPYVLGGAGVGAAAGFGLAKWGNVGLKGQAYNTYEDFIKQANDEDAFIKEMANKGDDTAKNWTTLKEVRETMQAETKKFEEAVPENIRNEQTFTDYMEKLAAQEKAVTEYDNKVAEAVGKAKEALKGPVGDDGKQLIETLEDGTTRNITWHVEGKGDLDAEAFKKFAESTDANDKKLFEDFAREHKATKELFGDGEKSLVKAEKEAKTKADEAFKKAEKTLSEKAKELKIEEKNIDIDKWVNAKKVFNAAEKEAKEKATDDVLKACKKVKIGGTALLGAAALALVGLLIRPKGDQV